MTIRKYTPGPMTLRPSPLRLANLLGSAMLGATMLAGCASQQGIAPSARAIDPATLGLKTPPPVIEIATPEAEQSWWRSLGSAELNRLVDLALASSPNLRVAQARLHRAQAGADLAATADGPKFSAEASAMRQRYTLNGLIPPPIAGTIVDSATLQANASWELDFFGRNQSALEAALGQARAAQADVQAARQLLATGVARTYLGLVRTQALLDVAERTLALRQQTRALVQDRVNAGLDTQLELQQSESALPDARLQIEMLQEQKSLALNALAALTAQSATRMTVDIARLDSFAAADVPATVPMDLLGRRPDITAARWRIEAALKDVEVARTQFYPNFNLVAFAGLSSLGTDRLFKTGSDQWGVGPAIRLPLFNSGSLRANLRSKSVDVDAVTENYNAQVLEAVHEVADRVASAASLQRQTREQVAAQAAAETAFSIALDRYKVGLGNYLQVLGAEGPVLIQRRQAVDLAARALDNRVQLLHAAGGTLDPAARTLTGTAAH